MINGGRRGTSIRSGNMGSAMAEVMLPCGHRISVYGIDSDCSATLKHPGAQAVGSPAALTSESDPICIRLRLCRPFGETQGWRPCPSPEVATRATCCPACGGRSVHGRHKISLNVSACPHPQPASRAKRTVLEIAEGLSEAYTVVLGSPLGTVEQGPSGDDGGSTTPPREKACAQT